MHFSEVVLVFMQVACFCSHLIHNQRKCQLGKYVKRIGRDNDSTTYNSFIIMKSQYSPKDFRATSNIKTNTNLVEWIPI